MDLRPVRRLERSDDLGGFDCGEPTLDAWFREYAYSDQQANVSVTYVLTRGDRVVGFYTLASHSIGGMKDLGRLVKGLPKERDVPVVLLARLALHKEEHGSGLGGDLLKDALARCLAVTEKLGVRAVLVHAKNDNAVNFYARYGFVPLPENPKHLYLLMKDIRASIQEAGQAQS